MTVGTVVVVSGAAPLSAVALAAVPEDATVIAADAGVDYARAAGLEVALAVGDFDSVSELGEVRAERHPREKDATDLELALEAAVDLRPQRILVLSGVGPRLDHLLVELALIASPRLAAVEVDAVFASTSVAVVHTERRLSGAVGSLISLVPMHGPATGVTTDGLVYPLRGETLERGSSRGASNEFAEPEARVSLAGGVLLALRPG